MCIYALYRYRVCTENHPLAWGRDGGRPFRIRACSLNLRTPDSGKEIAESGYGVRDNAHPCGGKETRIYYVDQSCHVCDEVHVRAEGYPYSLAQLPAANTLSWKIPYIQAELSFREVSYLTKSHEGEKEHPVSPKRTAVPHSNKLPYSEAQHKRNTAPASTPPPAILGAFSESPEHVQSTAGPDLFRDKSG